jgi:hypothetical protein
MIGGFAAPKGLRSLRGAAMTTQFTLRRLGRTVGFAFAPGDGRTW